MDEVIAWIQTRIWKIRIFLLCLFVMLVSITATLAAADLTFAGVLVQALIATVLIMQFRFWDDLADVPYDLLHTPRRVLVRSVRQTFHWRVLRLSLATAGVTLFWYAGFLPALIYAVAVLFTETVYRTIRPTGPYRRLRQALVLFKYPVFVVLLAATSGVPPTSSVFIAAAFSYLALSAFEHADQPAGKRA